MKTFVLFCLLLVCGTAAEAQTPFSVQFFLPGGALPAQKLRFTLTLPDGQAEILFTDANGKFSFPSHLNSQGEYRLVVESDKRSFDATIFRFRFSGASIGQIPLFLQPLKVEGLPRNMPKARLELAEYDAKVSADARAAYDQAMKFAAEGKNNEAIGEFTRALISSPQHLRALNELGMLYLKLNRQNEAVSVFTQAISLNSLFHPPLLNLAVIYLRQQNFTEAVRLFNLLLADHPTLSSARISYAEALSATQQWDEAEVQLREALKDPSLGGIDRARAHLRLGLKLNRDERFVAAAAELEKSVGLSPDSAAPRFYLGAAFMQLNKFPEAERELLKAYQLGGKAVASAQLLLGQLYQQQQKLEPALKAFEQFLSDMPTASNAPQVRNAVEELKAALKK